MPTPALPFAAEVPDANARAFVATDFGKVDLGHAARNQCFARVAEQISRHPGGTLPDKLSDAADYAAMDRLMNRKETTHARVLGPHVERTVEKMHACLGVVLLVQDTTVLDYSGNPSLRLGPVGNGRGTGYLCHNTLAIAADSREVLGLAVQELHKCAKVPRGEGVAAKRKRASEVIDCLYEEVLRHHRHKSQPHAPLTVLEFNMALARLGGHMNRKADGFPGWLTLWRGWQKLQIMVTAIANERKRLKKKRVES